MLKKNQLIQFRQRNRQGLVLLVVLGMLALFTLLAISYLSFTTQSRIASQALVNAKLHHQSTQINPDVIIHKIISGDRSNQSAFWGHSLLEDIYGRDAFEGECIADSAVLNVVGKIGLVKVQLAQDIIINPDPLRQSPSGSPTPDENASVSRLSDETDTYTGRVITFLEGPLVNHSYRILGYLGSTAPAGYTNSIAIDLSETEPGSLTYTTTQSGAPVSYSGSLLELLTKNSSNPSFLVTKVPGGSGAGSGFRYVINDMPFSGFGYGIENDNAHNNFGNLDQGRLVPGGNGAVNGSYTPGQESLPIALLPNYDYLKKVSGSSAIGSGQINGAGAYVEVTGSTNEGFDVADFHDYFLAHIPAPPVGRNPLVPNQGEIIPSFHRPELVNYIAQFMAGGGSASSLTAAQVQRLVRLIDFACARPLSYTLRNGNTMVTAKNPNFTGRKDSFSIPTLDIDLANWGPMSPDVANLENWVKALVGGGTTSNAAWDVDNDGDSVADSVWVDPNVPYAVSPEGRYLKVLASPLIVDLDGRLNLNTAGDLTQVVGGYQTNAASGADNLIGRRDPDPSINAGVFLPQGLGYGPAEIFLPRLAGTSTQNIIESRYGKQRGSTRPGQDNVNELFGKTLQQRELLLSSATGPLYGLHQSRRGRAAMGFDVFGNARMSNSSTAAIDDEIRDDAYESAGLVSSSGDDAFRIDEVENLLRRYDQDVSGIQSRIRREIPSSLSLNEAIYKSLTTRSVELRHPNVAAISRHTRTYSNARYPRANGPVAGAESVPVPATGTRLITNSRNEASMLRWIQMLYEERYSDRFTSSNPPSGPLELSDIRELFPLEFRKGLRLDINRPFGNGVDDDNDGMTDEPQELLSAQQETFTDGSTIAGTYAISSYANYGDPNHSSLVSRKMLARQLYCLAQLLIARDYPFAGLQPSSTDPGNLTIAANILYNRLRARELAQWAINVVDFRDQDSVYTRFEYDETPFEIDSGDATVWVPEEGRVVWGMEYPDLVFSETLAFHDLRLKDTNKDDVADPANGTLAMPSNATAGGRTTDAGDLTKYDVDFDQYRIPEGSLFFELFSPRSPNSPVQGSATNDQNLGVASSSIYNSAGQLDVTSLAPSGSFGVQPVFRIGIAESEDDPYNPRTPKNRDPQFQLNGANFDELAKLTNQISDDIVTAPIGNANNSSGLVHDLDTLGGTASPAIKFDRMVWFTTSIPTADQYVPDLRNCINPGNVNTEVSNRIFLNRGASGAAASKLIDGGGYMVIGPRMNTYVGSSDDGYPAANYSPSKQLIALDPTTRNVNLTDLAGSQRSLATTWPAAAGGGTWPTPNPVVMIATAAIPQDPAWQSTPPTYLPSGGIGLNVSEPLPISGRYYKRPSYQINPSTNPGYLPFPDDGYTDGVSDAFPDVPFDYNPDTTTGSTFPSKPWCLQAENKHREGTYLNHRTAYLQRLADPDRAYDPAYNPYITVDWMSIDLTVFNGEAPRSGNPAETGAPAGANVAFQSRYKDGARITNFVSQTSGTTPAAPSVTPPARSANIASTGSVQTGVSIFSSSTAEFYRTTAVPPAATPPYFSHLLGSVTGTATEPSSVTLGYLNAGRYDTTNMSWDGFGPPREIPSSPTPNTLPTAYQWAPKNPQANLVWLNRPFSSPYEIMLVPRVGPGQLGQFFTTPTSATTARYEKVARGGGATNFLPFVGYLPNFFSSEVAKTNSSTPGATYWQRPDKFANMSADPVGSNFNLILELIETPMPYPDAHRWTKPSYLNGTNQIDGQLLAFYQAPFNFFSRYTATGKINLNTMNEQGVFDALEGNYDNNARTGGGTRTAQWNAFLASRRGFTPAAGNFFTNPTDANGNLRFDIPTQFARPYRSGFGTNMEVMGLNLNNDRSVNRGLIRSDSTVGTNPPTTDPDKMLFVSDSSAYSGIVQNRVDAEITRQPYVDYQRAMRLPNLVSNQSNVFAVWVTIGLFEYDEVDGIGAEYVGPSGSVERTKSFYIIDRSIPVGFAPGKNYNAEKTILLRRKISR